MGGFCLVGEATATTAFDSMVTDAWSRLQNSNELQAYREATGKDIRMVMIPSLDDATTSASFLKPAMFWCVGADSDVKDAAIRFINFFTNSPECYDIVGIERAVPISSKMREYVAPTLDDVSEEVVEFIDYVSQPEMASPLMNQIRRNTPKFLSCWISILSRSATARSPIWKRLPSSSWMKQTRFWLRNKRPLQGQRRLSRIIRVRRSP